MQPFQGSQMVVIEKRKEDGSLDFSQPQPPMQHCRMCHIASQGITFDQVYQLYFQDTRQEESASWEQLKAWLDSKGWKIRAKTW
jgi:hypothetical protein